MTHTLQLTDGTTTVAFTSGDMYLAAYVPLPGSFELNAPNLKEQATIGFTTSTATIRANLASINRLLGQAANYDRNRTGAKVYLQFQPDGDSDLYRSQVFGGSVKGGEDMLGGEWGAADIEMIVEWTRQPYWEGPLTQIPLTNIYDDSSTDPLLIDNCSDTDADNTVLLASSDIAGDLPAPLKVELTNLSSSSDPSDELFMFHNVYSTPASLNAILEGENANVTTDVGSDSDCSSGQYLTVAWDGNAEVLLAGWLINSTLMGQLGGGKFAILARWFGVPSTDCWIRATLDTSDNDQVQSGELTLVSTTDGRELMVLDTMRIPPFLAGLTPLQAMNLRLRGKSGQASSSISIDYMQLSPIAGDRGWMHFRSNAPGVPSGETFVYDGTEGITYHADGTGKMFAEFSVYGGPILLVPNVTQRLYFNSCDHAGAAKSSQQWSVSAWYRPRRSTI